MDKKISALTGATTPLAGTEVLPIVQGGATVKVPVSDLTVGRAVSMSSVTATQSVASAYANVATLQNTDATGYLNTQFIVGPSVATIKYAPGIFLKFGVDSGDATTPIEFTVNNATSVYRMDATGNLTPLVAAKGINFTANTPAAGMTSQLLNWYEEGTWTPANGSGDAFSLSSATGKYTRIGRCVTITCSVTYPATAGTGAAVISGLPFTVGTPEGGLFLRYTTLASLAYVFPITTTNVNVYGTNGNTVNNVTLSTARLDLVGTYFI